MHFIGYKLLHVGGDYTFSLSGHCMLQWSYSVCGPATCMRGLSRVSWMVINTQTTLFEKGC